MGCLKHQALSRSMIEPVHNMVYVCVRQRIQGHAFRHILANQSIGVLVEPPLPGMIGMGKIYDRLHRLADPDMVGKLFAVVGRNGLGMRFMGRKQLNGGLSDFLGLFGGDFTQQRIARAPFDQRDEAPVRLPPITRSISPSPMRLFRSTMAGRWSMLTRSLICPRASALP